MGHILESWVNLESTSLSLLYWLQELVALSDPDRYKVKNKERQTHLVVHNLTETDSGLYYCSAVYPIGSSMSHVELKVSRLLSEYWQHWHFGFLAILSFHWAFGLIWVFTFLASRLQKPPGYDLFWDMFPSPLFMLTMTGRSLRQSLGRCLTHLLSLKKKRKKKKIVNSVTFFPDFWQFRFCFLSSI